MKERQEARLRLPGMSEHGITPLLETLQRLDPQGEAAQGARRKALRRLNAEATSGQDAALWTEDPELLRRAARETNHAESLRLNLSELGGQGKQAPQQFYSRLYMAFPEWREEMIDWPMLDPGQRSLSLIAATLWKLAAQVWDWVDPLATRELLGSDLTLPQALNLLALMTRDSHAWYLRSRPGPERVNSDLASLPMTRALGRTLFEATGTAGPNPLDQRHLPCGNDTTPPDRELAMQRLLEALNGGREFDPQLARSVRRNTCEELLWLGAGRASTPAARWLATMTPAPDDLLRWDELRRHIPSGQISAAERAQREAAARALHRPNPHSWTLSETEQLILWLLGHDHASGARWRTRVARAEAEDWPAARRQAAHQARETLEANPQTWSRAAGRWNTLLHCWREAGRPDNHDQPDDHDRDPVERR